MKESMRTDMDKIAYYVSSIQGYMDMKDYVSARDWCDKFRSSMRENDIVLAYTEQINARAFYDLGCYNDAITAAKKCFEYKKHFKCHRKEQSISLIQAFTAEVLDAKKTEELYLILICSGLKLQDISYLKEHIHNVNWTELNLCVFARIADILIEAMCTMGHHKVFYRLVKIIRANSELSECFFEKVKVCRENGIDTTCIENIDKWGVRKRTQKKLLEMIVMLTKVNSMIERLVVGDRMEQLESVLCDAQNAAISMGTVIEKELGFGTVAVRILELYCEALWGITQAEDDIECKELISMLSELMEREREEIINFPIKTVAVFMPYKASMWDSLESVWLAARDDELCDDYVVPIPYFDLDENKQFKKYNYEGSLFPEYVPITFYEEYNLEEEHPDMIYIHNPYDEFNAVISVAPDYYCSKIMEYTDNLVYIPYFVLGDIDPNNQVVIDGMKHFCFLPGTMFAHTVVLESENMRQIYINEFEKEFKRQGLDISREELEKKFLGLGSPKYDKVANTNKEELDVPSEWLDIIEKPDGSWKKIIFYNTTLVALLQDSEQMLEKIKDVLRIFKENKDEVALLWRPHPLMLQTIESMHPGLRDEYLEIVENYKLEGWGIYDDTADMNRAVVLSDAYYGDPSSVNKLFQELGKPVMIQNVEILN